MSDRAAILRLRRFTDAVFRGEVPAADDLAEVAIAFDCYATRRCATLDGAFDLQPVAGERDARTVLALAERDAAVVQGVRLCGSAAAFAERLSRYRTSAWRTDRCSDAPPTDEFRAVCWRALKARDATLSATRVRQIIAKMS